ncbi:MAG: hypothetical protein HY868_03565 [Chloroflexi bacterium]|nr:hypothetical protein [Chloroflexota bacterium]
MHRRIENSLVVFAFALLICLTACFVSTQSKPTIIIVSPPSGSRFYDGEEIAIQTMSSDLVGVTRVELLVDGTLVRTDPSPVPQGQLSFPLSQTWKATPGTHTIIVQAYNAAGSVSNPAGISVTVLAGGAPTATVPPSVSTLVPPTISASLTVTPTATSSICTDNAVFVADVTVPDGTNWMPGQTFNKIWRVRNTGCPWIAGYQLVFVGGEAMSATTVLPLPNTANGATADLLVPMTAPTVPGAHNGTWRLRNPSGKLFGTIVTVMINVLGQSSSPQTAVPAGPCSGTPIISSFTANPPNMTAGGRTVLTWGPVTNADRVEIDQDIGLVSAPGAITVMPTTSTTYTLTAYCGADSATAQVRVLVPFAILGSSTSANPSDFTGACPKTIIFSALITVNDAGPVTYKWESSDGSHDSSNQSITFGSAGSQIVNTTWTLGTAGRTYADYWIRLHILSPTDVTSNNATFTLRCN